LTVVQFFSTQVSITYITICTELSEKNYAWGQIRGQDMMGMGW